MAPTKQPNPKKNATLLSKMSRLSLSTVAALFLCFAVIAGLLQFRLSALLYSRENMGGDSDSSSASHSNPMLPSLQDFSLASWDWKHRGSTLKEERCAINFFGLPRAFESLVLPSVIENILKPNIAYQCDFFVHYYDLQEEAAGRSGKGGAIHPEQVLLLQQAVQDYYQQQEDVTSQLFGARQPVVHFVSDAEEEFWQQYADLIEKIRDTKDPQGRYLYFPWKARTYQHPVTVDNIVKMWHSIQAAWHAMEDYGQQHEVYYKRVAMLRADVVYVTPLDIYQVADHKRDYTGRAAIVPNFGKHPVSDRIIVGPHRAVQIWASERFSRLQEHVEFILENDPGWGMHSERFLHYTIFPAMEQAGVKLIKHPFLCFMRARADETVWISDCEGSADVAAPSVMKYVNDSQAAVERTLGRPCGMTERLSRTVQALHCPLHAVDTASNETLEEGDDDDDTRIKDVS